MNSKEQIERGMQLAKECSSKYANDANWHALRAHLERMTQTIPGGSWSVTPLRDASCEWLIFARAIERAHGIGVEVKP